MHKGVLLGQKEKLIWLHLYIKKLDAVSALIGVWLKIHNAITDFLQKVAMEMWIFLRFQDVNRVKIAGE